MSRKFKLALAGCCTALTLLTSASAQTAGSPDDAHNQANTPKVVHYIHAVPQSAEDYQPITLNGRLRWFVRSTVGPRSLTGGVFFSALGTAANAPPEYGTHWVGFGQRYGMRLTGISVGNAMEAGLGAIWGEDPRYFHTIHQTFANRTKNVVDLTFRAYGRDGERHPAYARYIAEFGNNFLSNTWRVPSRSDTKWALVRTGEGFGGRALSNAFSEFVPLLWRRVRHHPDPYPPDVHRP